MSDTHTGIVKWYNNKLQYGFITLLDDNRDVFVHSNALDTTYNFKCLFKGEYVSVSQLEDSDKGLQTLKVTGLNGGDLLCISNKQLVRLLNMSLTLPLINNWQQTNRRGKGGKGSKGGKGGKGGKGEKDSNKDTDE
tara:strand:- start:520 stop:927 length:408 start_codon:yes stop_codon:yes gene_type:complete